jgi:hypothetical protein
MAIVHHLCVGRAGTRPGAQGGIFLPTCVYACACLHVCLRVHVFMSMHKRACGCIVCTSVHRFVHEDVRVCAWPAHCWAGGSLYLLSISSILAGQARSSLEREGEGIC